ncbi:hypothetical protein [Methanosphaerula subterraneus]|uniref:hypothetical protein n=1 Tax=Methanosphaerula subterraneus TaxID=3350244 RepID=UPI003F82F769
MTDVTENQPFDQEKESESPPSHVSINVEDASNTVPWIGEGRRWYDLPYRYLNGVLYSTVGKRFPRKIRKALVHAMNYLIPYESLDRFRAWNREDPLHNLMVPDGESVRVPGMWVCEFFPPSQFDSLKQAFERHGWDRDRLHYGLSEGNQEILERARNGEGGNWWHIGSIVSLTSPIIPDAERRNLPIEFNYIDLVGLQVGPGLTAVVAHFKLSDQGQHSLDNVWHATHEPRLVRQNGQRRAEDRLQSGLSETQTERVRLHALARKWMAKNCSGVFAADKNSQQPLIDLLLLNKYDPSLGQPEERITCDALRALGIINSNFYQNVTDELPGLLLEAVDQFLCPTLKVENTWTLWGQVSKVYKAVPEMYKNRLEEYDPICLYLDQIIRIFFIRLAMSDFLRLKERQNSSLRDTARSRHGQFNRKELEELRDNFLSGSLDTSSIARDVRAFTSRSRHARSEVRFVRRKSAWLEDLDRKNGEKLQEEPVELDEELNIYLDKKAKELVDFDRDYREILSTVASLGASIDTSKIQRTAIIISVMALIVSLAGPDKVSILIWAIWNSIGPHISGLIP